MSDDIEKMKDAAGKAFADASKESNDFVQKEGASALEWAKKHWYVPAGFVALVIVLVIWG